jgi:hypothetical protein
MNVDRKLLIGGITALTVLLSGCEGVYWPDPMKALTLAISDPTTRGMGRFTEATSLSEGLVTQTISEGITFTAGALVPGILLWHVGR